MYGMFQCIVAIMQAITGFRVNFLLENLSE